MHIQITDYKNNITLSVGERYADENVPVIGLDALPDEELIALLLKLAEKNVRAMVVEMRDVKPAEVIPASPASEDLPL